MKQAHYGFSLLELMLVATLIAILATAAVPAYKGVVERRRTNRSIADIANLSLKVDLFELDSGTLPDTLAEAGIDEALDPWGRPYVYLNLDRANPAESRKHQGLIAINTDYDLYSLGPDGESRKPLTAAKSRDDVVRANDGAFIGKAEDY